MPLPTHARARSGNRIQTLVRRGGVHEHSTGSKRPDGRCLRGYGAPSNYECLTITVATLTAAGRAERTRGRACLRGDALARHARPRAQLPVGVTPNMSTRRSMS